MTAAETTNRSAIRWNIEVMATTFAGVQCASQRHADRVNRQKKESYRALRAHAVHLGCTNTCGRPASVMELSVDLAKVM